MTELPPYVLSVISRDLPVRRARWDVERVLGRTPPETRAWTPTPPDDPGAGLLVSVDGRGAVVRTAACDTPQGIVGVDDGYLVAGHHSIDLWSRDLDRRREWASSPWFNDLHSLRTSEHGTMIASSGTDSLVELAADGAPRWQWWGADHGFDVDSFDHRRAIDRHDDHRGLVYDTWVQATHVNSAAAVGADVVLATLFHQGVLACIDRRTGATRPVLDGLGRPHAVRASAGLTLADTTGGRGLVGQVVGADGPARDCRVEVTGSVPVRTRWLQDFQAVDGGLFVAVDGERPAVEFLTGAGEVVRRDELHPDWYLYEVAVG